MKYPVDIELLKKFVRNECTVQELAQIREFMLRPEYQKELDRLLDQQWEQFNPAGPTAAELSEWKADFEKRIAVAGEKQGGGVLRNLRWLGYAAAACILIPLLVSIFPPKRGRDNSGPEIVMKETVSPAGQRASITLPDNSVVTLGPGSRLKYPESFAGNKREITLEGEAFFEVTKNPLKPFIVHAGSVQTRVLGTSFKIDALAGNPVVVSLVTGKVRVSHTSKGKEEVLTTLIPGKQAGYDPATGMLKLQDFRIAEAKEWKDGLLSFSGVSLTSAIISLERWYGVSISLASASQGKKHIKLFVNGNKPVNQALETIKQVTGLNYKISGKEIKLY